MIPGPHFDIPIYRRATVRHGRTAPPIVAFLMLSVALMMALPAAAGELVTVDGVPHVQNGATPGGGVRTLELAEIWRRGGWDDEDLIFGVISRVLVDDEQNIYLLDSQLSEIKVLNAAGELVATLGREGNGPGEFRSPTDMCFLPDGTIGVAQAFPGQVTKLALDNTPAGVWTIGDPAQGAFYIVRGLRQGGGNVVLGGTEQHINQAEGYATRETFVATLDENGMRATTYAAKNVTIKFQELVFDELSLVDGPDRRYDVCADGRVVVAAPRNGYEVNIYARDGTLERVFSREYEPWQRNERAAGIWDRILSTIRDQQVPQAPVNTEATEPDIEFLRVAEDGNIWILTSRAMWVPPAGVFTEYDVFSPEGQFVEQVRVVCDGNPQEDMVFFAGEDLVFKVTGFWDAVLSRFGGAGAADDAEEAEPMTVVCYRIQ